MADYEAGYEDWDDDGYDTEPDEDLDAEGAYSEGLDDYVDEGEYYVDDRDLAPTGDAAVGSALANAGSSLAGGIGNGFSALRQVRRASRMRANAQSDVRDIERGLEEDKDELVHREDIERNYDAIVAAQQAELKDANDIVEESTADRGEALDQHTELTGNLRRLKERHDQELRPYRNLMDSTRGRSDDAAKALANAKRAVRSAEGTLNGATKRRTQRIEAANRAVDNAQERLRSLEHERDELLGSDIDRSQELAKVEQELTAQRTSLEQARAEVTRATEDAQADVDDAQNKLWSLQRDLADAEKVAEAAKEEATARKDEHDGLYKKFQAEEREVEESIKSLSTRMRDLDKTIETARERITDAQEVLDEAEEIHAHPETTEGLRQRIASEEQDLVDAQDELNRLSQEEKQIRRETRGSRAAFIAGAVALLVLIIFVVWFFVLRR